MNNLYYFYKTFLVDPISFWFIKLNPAAFRVSSAKNICEAFLNMMSFYIQAILQSLLEWLPFIILLTLILVFLIKFQSNDYNFLIITNIVSTNNGLQDKLIIFILLFIHNNLNLYISL